MKNRLLVIIGCTGTGKSNLGVEIAKRFNGEVINADSMQLYKGLDIATNKVTVDEMGGVRHHMMSFLEPSCSSYNVFRFREEVLKIIGNLWEENKLPIVVGGTSYYVESIIYQNYLIPTNPKCGKYMVLGVDHLQHLSNDELYDYLKKIDKTFADQVHKNNRLRVIRAIQIYEATQIRKSEHLAKQSGGCEFGIGGSLRFPNTLVFYLDADQQVLSERLDRRVEEMVKRGLREEIENFYDKHSSSLTAYGVYQSIGLKEFIDYLKLDEAGRRSDLGDELFKRGCDLVKVHSRQYARKQRSWVVHRLLRRQNCRDIPLLVRLDMTEGLQSVLQHTFEVVQLFFSDKDAARKEYQADFAKHDSPILGSDYQRSSNQIHHCDVCSIDVQGTRCWEAHLKGRRHKAMQRKIMKIKNANVETETDAQRA